MSTIRSSHRRTAGGLIAAALAAVAIAAVAAAPAPAAHLMPHHTTAQRAITPKAQVLRDAMRELWQAHGTWTERAIVDYVGDLPDAQLAIKRLLRNQVEIGDAVKPFYGAKGGAQLTKLLEEHINTAVGVLVAAKSGDAAATAKAKDAFYANGRQVAAFLHAANPRHWALAAMRKMMRIHLDQVVGLAVDQLGGRYAAAIRLYDVYIDHLMEMADMLSDGIIEQFPNRFR